MGINSFLFTHGHKPVIRYFHCVNGDFLIEWYSKGARLQRYWQMLF
jgi:hypothetical protein